MPFDRASTLAWLRQSPEVPVLIVGGGINGAGVLRELALNGIDALLVERADFASGATAASSRMIHGGLRYLETGEYRLVRESLRERNRLLRQAPHCVFPLPTVVPLFSRTSGLGSAVARFLRGRGRPSRRGAWLVRFGLTLYELLAGRDHALPRHRIESGAAARRQRPALHPDLIATATYFDAWNPQPERLCLEVLDDATRLHAAARALNYCALIGQAGREVNLRDELTGELLRVRPKLLVNAAGAWIDRANARLGARTQFIGGTKGSHLIVDHPELFAQTRGSEIFYENADGRICLIFPLHDRVLVGTTDIRIDDPDAAVCAAEEREYLIAAVRQVFPQIEIKPAQVLSYFCGVRPLPHSAEHFTGNISRDHECREMPATATRPFPVLALIGGKWTTFRAFAELAADRIFAHLGHTRKRDSRDLPIGGGRDFPREPDARQRWIDDLATRHQVPRPIAAQLFERHGTRAAAVAAHLAAGGPAALVALGPGCEGELDFIARHEAVVHLDDLLVRRTTLALFGHLDAARFSRVAQLAAAALGWDESRTRNECERTAQLLRERHGVALAGPASLSRNT